jgi:hypothetical protein
MATTSGVRDSYKAKIDALQRQIKGLRDKEKEGVCPANRVAAWPGGSYRRK